MFTERNKCCLNCKCKESMLCLQAKGYEKSLWEDKINMIHEAIEQCSKEKIHNKNVYKENIIL